MAAQQKPFLEDGLHDVPPGIENFDKARQGHMTIPEYIDSMTQFSDPNAFSAINLEDTSQQLRYMHGIFAKALELARKLTGDNSIQLPKRNRYVSVPGDTVLAQGAYRGNMMDPLGQLYWAEKPEASIELARQLKARGMPLGIYSDFNIQGLIKKGKDFDGTLPLLDEMINAYREATSPFPAIEPTVAVVTLSEGGLKENKTLKLLRRATNLDIRAYSKRDDQDNEELIRDVANTLIATHQAILARTTES